MRQTVLVTGGAGSVGREVSLLLAERGYRVRVFDLPGCDFSALQDATDVAEGDVTDPAALQPAVRDADVVLHLAAILPPLSERDRETTMAVNVLGTVNLVAALAAESPDARLVLSSSVCVYGDTRAAEPPVHIWSPLQATDIYAESKIAAERVVMDGPIDHTVMRISGIAVPAFLAPPAVWPFRPEQRIEFVCRDDVVTALVACVESDRAAGKVLNIAGGPTWRMLGREYVAHFNALMGLPPEEAAYDQEAGYFDWYDTREAEEILGYQHTSFERYLELLDTAITIATSGWE
jgi:nucleoside-diphosphate-sugar epimerase